MKLRIVILGLSITSSWGNGHATTYRALVRELARRGHDLLFLERDQPWYAQHRDLPRPPHGRTELYGSVAELRDRFTLAVRDADERRTAIALTVQQAQEALRLANVRFQAGVGTQLDVNDAQTALTQAQYNQVNAQYDFLGALARLQRSIGTPQ